MHARSLRRARRKGKSHGKQNHPHEAWGEKPAPFLEALHAQFSARVEELDQQLRIFRGQSITFQEEDTADKNAQEYETGQLEKERSLYEMQLEKLLTEQSGLPNENPTGKAARHRLIPVWLYFVALVILAVGEFFVTLPAVAKLLNDEGPKGYLITTSFASLSIIVAHLVGLSLKAQIDRVNPQPRWQIWGSSLLVFFITIVVLLLSAIRSDSVQAVPFTFGMSQKVFGTLLFFVVQMTFILSAVALSYFNHSELDSQLNKTRKKIKKTSRRIEQLAKARLVPSRSKMSPEKREVQVRAVVASMRLLDAQYREIAAEYRGANLLAQSEAMPALGTGLVESPLVVPDERLFRELAESENR